MKKLLFIVAGLCAFALAGFIAGILFEKNATQAVLTIDNQSGSVIMTAVADHEKGSAIAANIGKNRKGRLIVFTKGKTRFSLKATLSNNRTIYSASDLSLKNGDRIGVMVTDSTIDVSTTLK
jgi:hypothetical protein